MEDLLDIDEVIHTVNTVIIPLRASRIIKGQTSLVLFGTKMNVAAKPLKRGDLPLPRRLHLCAMLCTVVGVKRFMSPCTTLKISPWSSRKAPLLVAWLQPTSYPRKCCCQAPWKLWTDPKMVKLNS